MSKTLFNIDHQPAVIDHHRRAVMPGESHTFTDEQAAAGIAGCWSEKDPRAGLKAETKFKRRRDRTAAAADAQPAGETPANDQAPAGAGENKE